MDPKHSDSVHTSCSPMIIHLNPFVNSIFQKIIGNWEDLKKILSNAVTVVFDDDNRYTIQEIRSL